MEDMLKDCDLWEVASLLVRPEKMSQVDWDLKDRKAKGLIRLYLANLVLLNVLDEKTANSLLTQLGSMYQAKSLVKNLFLRKNLYYLRMGKGGSVIDNLNDFNLLIA